jgi:putative transcriptional regulator
MSVKGEGPAALLAVAAALIAGAAAPASELGRLRPGVFLYAAPSLGDPNFAETVVLLVKHGPEGAMGLIINRPTEDRAAEALPGVRLPELRLYRGGPVQPEAMLALMRGRQPEKAERVLEGVFMSGRREDLEAAARGGRALERVRLYSGYAGWSAGQLEKEIRLGGWVIGPADAAAIFSPEPTTLWRKVYQLLQRRQAANRGRSASDPSPRPAASG